MGLEKPELKVGKRFKSGTITSSSSIAQFKDYVGDRYDAYFVEINNLGFIPSLIEIVKGFNRTTVYSKEQLYGAIPIVVLNIVSASSYLRANVSPAYVNETGFKLPVDLASSSYTWTAYE